MPQGVPAVATETKSIAAEHPLLWHYTDLHAFRSIVAGNAIWGTFFDDLSDSVEFRHMREPLAKGMSERLHPTDREIRAIGNPRTRYRTDCRRRFAWRGHRGATADANSEHRHIPASGKGPLAKLLCRLVLFASGRLRPSQRSSQPMAELRGGWRVLPCLRYKRLEELIEEERAIYQYWSIGLNEAHYFEDGKDLPSSFVELAGLSEAVVALAMSGANFSTDELFVPFVVSAATIKHSGFEEEREVRLVAMAMSQIGDEKLKSVPGICLESAQEHLSLRYQRQDQTSHPIVW